MRIKTFLCVLTLIASNASSVWAGSFEDALIAAREGRIEVISALIQRGLDVNTADRDGTTLLGIAARSDNLALVDMLLNNRASPNRRNSYGDTPVLLAASQGKIAIVKRLVAAGAEINLPGWTPLHYAVYGSHTELADYLLVSGAETERRAPNQQTPLMLAAQSGNLVMVKLLVAKGADISATDPQGKTAADIAAAKGFSPVADYLRAFKPVVVVPAEVTIPPAEPAVPATAQ